MFQSSITSWSSKIIALGTVEISHRMAGSRHESQYSRAYSSKSATSSVGQPLRSCGGRPSMNSRTPGEISSA